jgi:hypothetical protein
VNKALDYFFFYLNIPFKFKYNIPLFFVKILLDKDFVFIRSYSVRLCVNKASMQRSCFASL